VLTHHSLQAEGAQAKQKDKDVSLPPMRKRLEKKVGKKIKVAAILYTHSHYTDGTDAWLDEGTEIWGHEYLDKHKRADSGVF